MGGGVGEGERATERERREGLSPKDGRDSILGTTDSSVDHGSNTARPSVRQNMRVYSSYKPTIFVIDSGFSVDSSSGVLLTPVPFRGQSTQILSSLAPKTGLRS